MMFLLILAMICLGSQCMAATNDEVAYFEQIITAGVSNAATFQLPTRNDEFEEGSKSDTILDYGTFDFIIVGSGSSGSVMARRLSDDSRFNILLLEAGGEETDFSDIPAMFSFLLLSEMNWGYFSKPQTTCCLSMNNNSCAASRGKVIGGSSTINNLMYVRGNKKDYDKWEAQGNSGWSYKHVLPYFKKSENSLINGDPGFHGEGGLWNVEYDNPVSGTFQNFFEANEELSRKNIDYNGKQQLGFSQTQHNTKNGRRASLSKAFLEGARSRANLNVTTRAYVTKIVIEKKVAEGVIFIKDNKKYLAKATKEVIVSGGAFNSPQLLLLSGIGPKKDLERLNIPVVKNLPVGQNFKDHLGFYSLNFRTNFTLVPPSLEDQIQQYLNGVGPLTLSGDSEGIGYINTKFSPPGVPTIEYIYLPSNNLVPNAGEVFNYNAEIVNDYLPTLTPNNDITIFLILLHPKSVGSVTLKSNDPIDFPVIDYNYFSDSKNEDIQAFIEGIDFAFQMIQKPGFQKINATFISLPICKQFQEFSKPYWECVLRHTTSSQFHPCGTTRMGPNKKTSVVNREAKVHGIKNLRVVDAGIIPVTISGHLNAVAVMIAEKIADVIKKQYKFNQ